MPLAEQKKYTADEYYSITQNSNELTELINGEIICMASPNEMHQTIAGEIFSEIRNYIRAGNGNCRPFIAPFDVKLDDHNVVIPDIMIICDSSKLDGKRCNGAPDLIIEITSGNWRDDYTKKLALYMESGVKEYWIVDQQNKKTLVYYSLSENLIPDIYTFDTPVPVGIYRNNPVKLEINISELLSAYDI